MGLFSKSQENSSRNIYASNVLPNLHAKDGNKHIIMITSFSKWIDQVFGVESKYTTQIGHIVDKMQEDGYKIVAIEHTTLQNQGLFKSMEGFHTLITYK
ncbi:hypothetical protein [Oenococcus sp.]|uniref:hypothetical protein n=1 Tax=Oenococcus sp. TaxID=1979414 RepID=UPI0039E9382F